jgi:galactose oxidase
MKIGMVIALTAGISASAAGQQQGAWEDPFDFGDTSHDDVPAVSLIHIFDGYEGKIFAQTQLIPGSCLSGDARLWTPPAMGSTSGDPGTFEAVPFCDTYVFCGGHCAMADGRILFTGGGPTSGTAQDKADIMDPQIPPSSGVWNNPCKPPNMSYKRWYPTTTTLSDGTVLAAGGTLSGSAVDTPELFEPTVGTCGTWTTLTTAQHAQAKPGYPYMFLAPDGRVFDASPAESRFLDPSTWTWASSTVPHPTWPSSPTMPGGHGSAVMYEPGKIMVAGGANPGNDATWVVDLDDPNGPQWYVSGDLNVPRRNHDLVILPDGKVLCIGGNASGATTNPVMETELWDPASGQWALQPSITTDYERWYHSTAILLQDGRVAACGGNNRPSGQIFQPPYITSGAPRPEITDAPIYMEWGEGYTIEYDANEGQPVTKAALIRLGSVTHGFDQDQRYIPLTITSSTGGSQPTITVNAPADGNIAPPGYYMLWILSQYANNAYAPCELAAYVQVGP